jgi:HIV Tat-specific factor 1
MNGRSFAGSFVEAYIADGTERFKKGSKKTVLDDDDEDAEDQQRLDQFGQWIEQEGGPAPEPTPGSETVSGT